LLFRLQPTPMRSWYSVPGNWHGIPVICIMKAVALLLTILRSRVFLLTTGIAVAILIAAMEGRSQSNSGFLYGKVYTRGNSYEGQIRWGNEEAFWTDYFNAAKISP